MKELIRVMNLPRTTVEVTRTSDGFYLGRAKGDIGFNQFFGKPSHLAGPGRDASRVTFQAFTFGEKRKAVQAARSVRVPLRSFLGVS